LQVERRSSTRTGFVRVNNSQSAVQIQSLMRESAATSRAVSA
jgi:hypothetical protein